MDLGLKGQKALIMGGSKGIGFKIAEVLAVEGADVALFARSKDRLYDSASKIEELTKVTPLVFAGDAKRNGDIKKAVEGLYEQFGQINILVNCVGGYTPSSFLETSDIAFLKLLETKLMGYIKAMREVIPIMKKQNSGRILNIAGNSGKFAGYPPRPHAGSVNAAVINISKAVADDVAPFNILVNSVSPGITLSEHAKHIINTQAVKKNISFEDSAKELTNNIPLGSLGEPKDIADLVAFLVSPRNRWITGTAISVDGGTNRSIV